MPSCKLTLRGLKSKPYGYPTELKTLGDHLKAKRLDRNLRQIDVARILGASQESVINWETNACPPAVRFQPAVDEFLGYCLVEPMKTTGDRLRIHRTHRGLSRRRLARFLGVDPGSISRWEASSCQPDERTFERLVQTLRDALEAATA